MRRILRRIAHKAMEKAGLKRVNKCGYGGKSVFASHWREWA